MPKLLNTLSLLLLLALGHAHAQPFNAEQAASALTRYRTQLEALEQEVGRYDPRLLEYLERLAEASIELDQFSETDDILDRAIQILRIDEGLYTEAQFPFLALSVRNDARRGNWRDANEMLDHLTWLYTAVPREWDEKLIAELQQLSDLHLEGVAGDAERMKDSHFRAADRITWVAVQVAETIWPADDSRLVELYYHQIMQNHLKLVTLNRGGEASLDLRQIVAGAGWMRPRRAVGEVYYRLGIEMLSRMRRVYALQDPPNLEAIALIEVYEADWQVIFDQGSPAATYRRAFANLLEAGVGEEALGEFFSVPRVLPMPAFYPTLQQAQEAFRTRAGFEPCCETTLHFAEWSSALPNVQVPIARPLLLQRDLEPMSIARVAVRLDATNKVGRWIRGRYVSQISVTDGFEWLGGSGRRQLTEQQLAERLHYVNFRPVLEAGVPQPFEGILEYHYFPIDRE